jgi:hypothetical protein
MEVDQTWKPGISCIFFGAEGDSEKGRLGPRHEPDEPWKKPTEIPLKTFISSLGPLGARKLACRASNMTRKSPNTTALDPLEQSNRGVEAEGGRREG